MTPRRAQRGALRGQRAPPDKTHTLCIISCTSHNLPAIVASVGEDASRHRKRDNMNFNASKIAADHNLSDTDTGDFAGVINGVTVSIADGSRARSAKTLIARAVEMLAA